MLFEFKDRCFEILSGRCILFGILNLTPDSFSDGGQFVREKEAVGHALRLQQEGADVIDIGGESTRPGASPVSAEEEMERILPVVRLLRKQLSIPISVDTMKAAVAKAALAEGAEIINDVSGLGADPEMAKVVASSCAGLILVHSRGTPTTMQRLCDYQNVVEDVQHELHKRIEHAVAAGISRSRIAIDPGIGFAKTMNQNWMLLHHLKSFISTLKSPIMVGLSRKSFLGGEMATRGPATLAAELLAAQQGVHMIRTHDVGATHRMLTNPSK